MARTDLEALVYQISVDTTKLRSQLDAANGIIRTKAREGARHVEAAGSGLYDKMLNRNQLMELQHSVRASFDAIAAGASPLRVIAMEGPRVAQALGSGQGGVAGALGAIGAVLNPVTISLAALGGALIAGGISAFQYAHAVGEVEKAVRGLQNISGLTTDQIVAQAEKLSSGSAHGVRSIIDVEAQLVSTGAVAGNQLEAATTLIEHFADRTNGNLKEMTKLFAGAFTDPAEGAKLLGSQYGLLNKAEADHIAKLEQQHGKTAALSELMADLRKNLKDVTTDLYEQKKGWDAIGAAIGKAWDAFGNWTAHALGFQTKGERIAQIDRELAQHASGRSSNFGFTGGASDEVVRSLTAERARLVAELNREADEQKRVGANRQSNRDSFGDGKEHKSGSKRDGTASAEREAAAALDSAEQRRLQALAALTTDIEAHAAAEKAAIDAELVKQGDALDAELKKIEADKSIAAAKKAQLAATLQSAYAADVEAADARKRKIDVDAENALADKRLEQARAISQYYDEIAQISLGQARTATERAAIEAKLLANQKRIADLAIETARKKELATATPGEATGINSRFDAVQAASDDLFGARFKDIANRNLSPWRAWAKQGAQSADEVGEALQAMAVRGMDEFNDGLAESIVRGKSLGDVMRSVFQSMEADLIKYLAKQAEIGLFGGGASILSGLPLIGGLFGGHRANGGPVTPGKVYMVGERGPEPFIPSVPGTIVPNSALRGLGGSPGLRSAGSTTIRQDFTVKVDVSGANGDQAVRAIAYTAALQGAHEAVKASKASMPVWAEQNSYERG